MADSKIINFVETLKFKTINGKVVWEATSTEGVFMASFSNYSVQISQEYFSSPSELDLVLKILNNDGSIIEVISDVDLKESYDNSYLFLNELYSVARRQAMGVENAIDSILAELAKDDEIPF
jgi:hypothetical protein